MFAALTISAALAAASTRNTTMPAAVVSKASTLLHESRTQCLYDPGFSEAKIMQIPFLAADRVEPAQFAKRIQMPMCALRSLRMRYGLDFIKDGFTQLFPKGVQHFSNSFVHRVCGAGGTQPPRPRCKSMRIQFSPTAYDVRRGLYARAAIPVATYNAVRFIGPAAVATVMRRAIAIVNARVPAFHLAYQHTGVSMQCAPAGRMYACVQVSPYSPLLPAAYNSYVYTAGLVHRIATKWPLADRTAVRGVALRLRGVPGVGQAPLPVAFSGRSAAALSARASFAGCMRADCALNVQVWSVRELRRNTIRHDLRVLAKWPSVNDIFNPVQKIRFVSDGKRVVIIATWNHAFKMHITVF